MRKRENETNLILIVQLSPARDERSIEEIPRERMINLGQIRTRTEREGRRRFEQLYAQSLHPLSPIVRLGSIDRLPRVLEHDLIDGKLADSCVRRDDVFVARRKYPAIHQVSEGINEKREGD